MQRRIGEGADADGDVGALFQQVNDQVIAVEFELNVRIELPEFVDVGNDGVEHERRGGIDAQASGRSLLARRQTLFELIHLIENQLGLFEEILALLGQVHAPRGAVDQRGVELGFELRQRATDGRRRLADLLGGGGNRTALDHADENLQLIGSGFHGCPRWNRRSQPVAMPPVEAAAGCDLCS